MEITAQMVKELRELTGAGMMDCKKALTDSEGDMEKAQEVLRQKGISSAEKKMGGDEILKFIEKTNAYLVKNKVKFS